ncbi:MAG: fatty acyl-AMP ligase, partial [Anaerolineae bacterium]|nr:fatty acyl-AMP ligase [Anaerolineae bacterium]
MTRFDADSMGLPLAPRTLLDVAQQRGQHQAHQLAYTFLLDGEGEEATLTYGQLDRRARAIAARLQAMGVADGQRALLLYQPSLDYVAAFLGCLYAGAVAVPSYPPDPFRMERTFPRFHAIVTDSAAAAVLTTAMILDLAGELFDEHPDLQPLQRLATDEIADDEAEAWQPPAVDGSTLAFLQYTSGSTAQPKGVMLTHDNLLANLAMIREGFGMVPEDVGMIWLPPYHDMGLIGGILQPLYAGFPVVLMSPLDFLQRPLRWLRAITRHRATVSGGPNFAYDLAARKVTDAQKATLDLSTWKVAFNGAEPVRRETLERFSQAFAGCGFRPEAFYPCYGLAEGTLIVSGGRRGQGARYARVKAAALGAGRAIPTAEDDPDGQPAVGCGTALGQEQILIVDPETRQPLPDGQVGEVWVSGPNVAVGYWNRPQETAETFHATPAPVTVANFSQKLATTAGARFLRTGDLGFILDGELFIAGRIKDLIIVDGQNHYPQDIELTVEKSHPALRPGCAAAFPVTVDGEERLAVAVEVAKNLRPARDGQAAGEDALDPEALRTAIRRAVTAGHDLRVHAIALLKAGSIPKTSSGKIQRHACRQGFL